MPSTPDDRYLELLPAVDIKGGQAVQLVQGVDGSEKRFGDPIEAALRWQEAGAEWIHLVDLDAAFGHGHNRELQARIVGALDIQVEMSGGIRDDESLEAAMATGCRRVNIGTAALEQPEWCAQAIATYGDRVAIGLDVRGTTLAARGWTREGGDLYEVLARLDSEGCARYVVTDVNKDGMLQGPNLQLLQDVCAATDKPVVASGGVTTLDDIEALMGLVDDGVEGAIAGTALYEGRFSLEDALALTRGTVTVEFTDYHTRLAAYVLLVDEQERVLLAWWNGEGHSDSGVVAARWRDRLRRVDPRRTGAGGVRGDRISRASRVRSLADQLLHRSRQNLRRLVPLPTVRLRGNCHGRGAGHHRGRRLDRPRRMGAAGGARSRNHARTSSTSPWRPVGAQVGHAMSLSVRVIPCLDVDGGRVVKGINFVELRDAGDPVELARAYDAEGADELTFLDISASHEGRATTMEIVSRCAEEVFIPLTVGGGVSSVEDVDRLLRAGADKVAMNTAAINRPELIAEVADRFGNQVLVLSVDARRADGTGSGFEVTTHGGRNERRPGRRRVGGPRRRARRGGDPAQRHGRRRHPGRLRPRAHPGRTPRGEHPGHRQRWRRCGRALPARRGRRRRRRTGRDGVPLRHPADQRREGRPEIGGPPGPLSSRICPCAP